MDEFTQATDPAEDERDHAFQEVIAIREAVSLAKRDSQPITYEAAMIYMHDISPPRYEKVVKLLTSRNQSITVKYFVEMAESLGAAGDKRSPAELIQAEIDKHEALLQGPGKKKHLRTHMHQLLAAKQHFEPRKLSEHRLLEHDAFLAERTNLPKPDVVGAGYQDYKLDNNRRLRIRLIHPDKEEAVLGTDLVYEQYDLLNERVRFVHMQYKRWSNWSINLKQKSLPDQLDRMETHFCKAGHCMNDQGSRSGPGYRLPYCAAFLRPTSPMKADDSKMISTGDHVPVCFVNELRAKGEPMRRSGITENSLSFRVFDELFMNNLVGSRWIPIDELESFYSEKGLDGLTATIRVLAQEVILASEEEIGQKKRTR